MTAPPTRPKVFISSTFPELIEYRKLVIDTLIQIGVEPVESLRQESLESKAPELEEFTISLLGSSELFIGIYGSRIDYKLSLPTKKFGSVEFGSLVETEYDVAVRMNKKIFAYFGPVLYEQTDRADREATNRMQEFKRKVSERSGFKEFSESYDLADKVTKDISGWLAQRDSTAPPSQSVAPPSAQKQEPIKSQQTTISPAEDALQKADGFRRLEGYASGGSEFLLLRLLDEPDEAAAAFVAAAGVQPNQVADILTKRFGWPQAPDFTFLEKIPQPTGLVSPELQEIYKRAQEIANENSRELRTRDLFAAMLDLPNYSAGQWLNETFSNASIPLDWVKETIRSWPADRIFSVNEVQRSMDAARPAVANSAYSDAAAAVDKLDFDSQAKAIAEIILKPESVPPIVIGVYGPWGSGKSTFLNLVQTNLEQLHKQLEKEKTVPDLICVEYNAWAYTDAAKLWAGLVQKISKHLDDQLTRWQRVKYAFKHQARRFIAALLVGLIAVGALAASVFWNDLWAGLKNPLLETIVRAITFLVGTFGLERIWQQRPLAATVDGLTKKVDTNEMSGVMNKVRDELQTVIQDYFAPKDKKTDVPAIIREGKIKVVVFIDELDRCPLDRIVHILEAIKLFLAEEIFIVLIAVDTRIAAEAIHVNYKDVTNPELAREYLEKIVQIPLRVPRAKPSGVQNYLKSLMKLPESTAVPALTTAPSPISTPIPVTETTMQRSTEIPKPTAPPAWQPLELRDTLAEHQIIAELGAKYLDSNPRRLKRLLNTYRYVKILCKRANQPTHDQAWQTRMIAWLVFTLVWPDFMLRSIQEAEAPAGKVSQDPFLAQCLKESSLLNRSATGIALTESDILAYLNLSSKQVLELAELASNFLIEGAPTANVATRSSLAP